MLPSTGYFKGFNCPFYDSGLCERPYCHFRHVKKESQNPSNYGFESEAILQKLVSETVQKVLQQTEASVSTTATQPVISDSIVNANKLNNTTSVSKATYNPTPISELKKINSTDTESNEEAVEQRKRHIPVPYTPRKPASLPIKRPAETNGSFKPFVYIPPPVKYTPGCAETVQLDPYTPKGSTDSTDKYLPGTESELQEYAPTETQSSNSRNYVPSDKSVTKKKILEYKPIKVKSKNETPSVTYQPTPRSLAPCFSSDEEEPDIKKRKISNDLNGLDFGPEFDILDQILDEEKPKTESNSNIKKDKPVNRDKKEDSKEISKDKENHGKIEVKKESKKHHDKTKPEKREKSVHGKEKHDSKSKDSTKKSHKSSSKNKEREERKDKSTEKKRHSSSKSSSKPCESKLSKHSKHSSSSKGDSKSKDKVKSSSHRSHKSDKGFKEKHKKSRTEKSVKSNDLSDNDNHDSCFESTQQEDVDITDISESDEETIALECKRIFEEYVPTEKTVNIEETDNPSLDDTQGNEYIPGKIRISRTTHKNIKILPKAPIKPDYKVSAAQAMADRLAKIKEFHASRSSLDTSTSESTTQKTELPKSVFSGNTGNSKIRIAHVPYASTMMNAKKTIPPQPNIKKDEPSTSSTIVQTIKKGAQRVAHMPNEKFIDRPGVLEPLASKIPANIRSTYLNMMIDECLKIYLSATDAYARAQHEELSTSKKCSTVQIYKNSAVLTVSRLRKELQECNGVKKLGSDCGTLQKLPNAISGKTGNSGSWSIENKNRRITDNIQEFTGAKFYNNIKKWVLTEEQLQDNGFPRPHISGEKGRAIIYGQNKQKPPVGYIRTCCRCKKDYTVDKKNFPAIKEECIYHPNRKYRVRGEARYQCCSQDETSDGCCIAPCHVYEYVDYDNLKGFVRTLHPEAVLNDYGVYALDCEMCYTTNGLDLTRVTVINSSCKVVYETLIKPLHPIIDYNTRYSGITEEQMSDVKTTLLEVQATLLTMFSSKTILIGHSLESDFKALKLIHNTVVDTSVLFPHKMGPPYKRALRNLSSEYLKKIIQNSVDGHDSAEDAMVCMELIIYKLKEDLKTR